MAVVYVTKPGVKIHREQGHLLVQGENFKQTIFTFNLERLVLVGKVEMTHAALTHLFRNQTPVTYLSRQGSFLGSIVGPDSKNVFLRVQQYEKNQDNSFRLQVAAWIVKGKILNMRTLILRMARTLKFEQLYKAGRELKKIGFQTENTSDLDHLRGIEGQATKIFFQAYRLGFPKELGFGKRVRRPPTDPVNACLSYGYTILMNIVHGAVCAAGLDATLGCLHDMSYGRNSLSLDLMEEYRTPVVDMTVLACFNLGVLKNEDFIREDPGIEATETKMDWVERVDMLNQGDDSLEPSSNRAEGDGPVEEAESPIKVYLQPHAKKKYINRLEKRLDARMYYEDKGKSIPIRRVIQLQAQQYASLVRGDANTYRPISPR